MGMTLACSVGWMGLLGMTTLIEPKLSPAILSVYMKDRINDFLSNLDSISSSKKDLLFLFGSSEVEAFLDPRVLEKTLLQQKIDVDAYNLGLRVLTPFTLLSFTTRIADELERRGRKVRYSLVQVPRLFLTKKFAEGLYELSEGSGGLTASLITTKISLQLMGAAPAQFASLLMEKAIWQGRHPGALHSALANWMILENVNDPDNPQGPFYTIWKNPIFMERPAWSLQQKGLFKFNLPKTAREYEAARVARQSPGAAEANLRYLIDCCDLVNSEFSPKGVAQLVKALQWISQFSDEVILFHVPERQEVQRLRGSRGDMSMKRLLKRIEAVSEIRTFNYTGVLNLVDSDYDDVIHLSEQGQEKLFARIARDLSAQ